MKKIVLVSCVKSKLDYPAQAKDLYISPLFKFNMKYAESFNPDMIFILSAKYGLLSLDQMIEPYEKTLNKMREGEKKAWANQVFADLKGKTDINQDLFIFLAGTNYRKYLIPMLTHVEIPLEGFTFGQQLSELKRRVG